MQQVAHLRLAVVHEQRVVRTGDQPVDVRRQLSPRARAVAGEHTRADAAGRLEWVDADHDVAHVRVDHLALKSQLERVEQALLRQLWQVEHVIVERQHVLGLAELGVRGCETVEERVGQLQLRRRRIDADLAREHDRRLECRPRVDRRRVLAARNVGGLGGGLELSVRGLLNALADRDALRARSLNNSLERVAALHEHVDHLRQRRWRHALRAIYPRPRDLCDLHGILELLREQHRGGRRVALAHNLHELFVATAHAPIRRRATG